MSRSVASKHVLCVSNEGYRVALVVRRVYQTLADEAAERRGLIRVIDESGEDYLFPSGLFVALALPVAVRRLLNAESTSPSPRRAAVAEQGGQAGSRRQRGRD